MPVVTNNFLCLQKQLPILFSRIVRAGMSSLLGWYSSTTTVKLNFNGHEINVAELSKIQPLGKPEDV